MRPACLLLAALALVTSVHAAEAPPTQHLLYVAVPGIRDHLQYGGHGILVFDIDHDHQFLRRIKAGGLTAKGKPSNVKGICASVTLRRLYVSTIESLAAYNLNTDALVWEHKYEGGCDRMAISPTGVTLYLPSFEKDFWNVVDGSTGTVITRVSPQAGAHNTIYGANGKEVYLAGLRSTNLAVADPSTHTITRQVGPFSASVRPFTVNGRQTLGYFCVNNLLGFEIGELTSGKVLGRVEVPGFQTGPVARHGCPSHGIGLTPDEKEIWLCDSHNRRLHVFDATANPPKLLTSIAVRDEPGWVTFSLDGRYAYPSTGDVIDVAARKIIATLTDETGAAVQSEKMLELDFSGRDCVRAGCQFGVGQVGVE